MFEIKQSTAETIVFFVHDSAGDAVLSLVDGGFTKRISKGSGSFGAMTVTITEMENGFYSIPLSTGHSDTTGILTVVFTHGSSKQTNLQWRVEAKLVDDLATDIGAAQSDLDIITGASGVNLLTATQASIDAIEADTNELQGDDVPGLIATVTTDLDDIKGTGFVKDTHSLFDIEGYVDILDDGTSGNAKIATDVAAVLVDTADMQPKLGSPASDVSADIAAVKVDTAATLVDTAAMQPLVAKIPLSDGSISWNATALAAINTQCDTALTDYDGPTNTEMEARTPTAAQLAYIVAHAATAVPVTFSGGTTTTAILTNVDGSGASSVDDFYNGRILVFNVGTLDIQATDITDYDGGTTTATITATTTAVTGSHTALLV